MLTLRQQVNKHNRRVKIRRWTQTLAKMLGWVAGLLIIGLMLWLLAQAALKAFDQTWESRCPVWYHIDTPDYDKCMQK